MRSLLPMTRSPLRGHPAIRIALYALLASPLSAAIASGCGSSDDSTSGSSAGSTQSTSGQSTASAATSSGGAGGGGVGGTGQGGATGGVTQCTDGIDNDGDGLIDAWDPECIGPLDNDESSFATGIPGDNIDPCKQDCFFDGNSGQGDDKCEWDLDCDPKNPGAPKCPYDPNKDCKTQGDDCIKFCSALTPNGCDCFGCCEIPLGDGSTVTILIGDQGCDAAHANDPTVCSPCTQSTDCINPCDPCEYCLGKNTLPPECTPDGGTGGSGMGGSGGTGGCPSGEQACSPSVACPPNYYCLTGCCVQIPN